MKHAEFSGKTAALLLLAVLTLAAGLRLWQLERPALWEDDSLNLDRAMMPLGHMWQVQKWQGPADTPYDFQPPLYFALLHGALQESGSVASARMVSVVAGVLAVWGTFALGRRLFGAGPGFLAALLLALSLFHLEYSRAIKAYGLFYCFSVWSAYFVHAAARGGGLRHWLAWGLTATGMLYSAYIGLPAFAGQALWAAGAVLAAFFRREPGSARKIAALGTTSLAVGAAYLPWLPAVFFLQRLFHDPGVNPLARMNWGFFGDVLAGFSMYVFQPPSWQVPVLAGLAVLGALYALLVGRAAGLALLLCWAGLPTASVLLSKSVMNEIVSSRHLFNLLAPATLLPAVGIWALASIAESRRPVRPVPGLGLRPAAAAAGPGPAPILVAIAVCLGVSWPQVAHLPTFYARSISLDREYFYWLWATGEPSQALSLEGWKRKSKAFSARWHLPGLFESPGDFSRPGFRRLLIVENQAGPVPLLDIPDAQTVADDRFGPFRTRTQRLGALSRSPLAAWPDASGAYVYEDDFSTPRMHRDAYASVNVAPDLTLGHLAPVRGSQPGEVVYRFVVPPGASMQSVQLALAVKLYKRNPDRPADSRLEILAGAGPHAMKPVGSVTHADFPDSSGVLPIGPCQGYEEQPMYQTCAKADVLLAVPGEFDRELWVAVRFAPGVSEGFLEMDGLRLRAAVQREARPGDSPLSQELESLLANGRVSPWRPGAASLDGLFAFAPDDAFVRSLPEQFPALGTSQDLERFRTEHPGLAPVHELRDASGRAQALFFDPSLALSDQNPAREVRNGAAFSARGIVVAGRMNGPSLSAGDARLDIPVAAPSGSVLLLNPGGQGRLIWSPDFSRDALANLDASSQDNLRPTPDADNDGGITCREERPCHFMASFVSGLPMSRVRLEWYPRVVASLDGKNVVRLSYSTDQGRTFTVLEEFKGRKTGTWSDMFTKHAAELDFARPVNHFLLKVELSGEGAQLWSHRRAVDRMWLEATLDARSVAPLALPEGGFPLRLSGTAGNDFTLRFAQKPIPLFDSIKDWR
ncbi:MAG: glycosyltransferase family 39 protein [Acidobacteriota bacterium]